MIFQNSDWIKTFMFSVSSLIIEDLSLLSFLFIFVLKSSVQTSLLSSWAAAVDFLATERLLALLIYKRSILQYYFEDINNSTTALL